MKCVPRVDGDAEEEILAIDAMEDSIAPLGRQAARIRSLIKSLEVCHHKAGRWVDLIIEAIGSGRTSKGPGTRPAGRRHPVEQVWQNCFDALSAWCSGSSAGAGDVDVGGIPATQLVSFIGDRTPLKVWQVRRAADKVRSFLEARFLYLEIVQHPERYREHLEFRDRTLETIIHDTVDGKPAELSLAAAIDHLEPCHWNFVGNLAIVLKAIGGDLFPDVPFASCGRNRTMTPIRARMRTVSATLRAFREGARPRKGVDSGILRVLGERTPVRCWLAASLDKTIRVQLDL